MKSEPVLLIGVILVMLPGLTAAAHVLPAPWGRVVAGVLSALAAGAIFYLRSKVSPAVAAASAALEAPPGASQR